MVRNVSFRLARRGFPPIPGTAIPERALRGWMAVGTVRTGKPAGGARTVEVPKREGDGKEPSERCNNSTFLSVPFVG